MADENVHLEPVQSIPHWALHRRLYQWTLSLAEHRHATLVLALVSFTEAIFFPIPSIILQVPMTLQSRKKAWTHATVNSVCNVLGGIAGYGLGALFSEPARKLLLLMLTDAQIDAAQQKYSQNLVVLTAAAVAVHPYKLFTIAAGLFKAPLGQFLIASVIGRFGLFFAVAALLYWIGPPAKRLLEKYFNIATVVLGVLLIGGLLLYQQFSHS